MKLKAVVSAGEIVDKATILEIKASRIDNAVKVINVIKELEGLSPALNKIMSSNPEIKKLKKDLYSVNCRLWDIENSIRALEAKKDFGGKFVELARSVYKNNDKRARLKNRINTLSGSDVKEEKEYNKY